MTDTACTPRRPLHLMRIVHGTTADGPGFRTAIYAAGCMHRCVGCQNPQTWPIQAGTPYTIADVMNEICADELADVTLTGGDPLYQAEAFTELARDIKQYTRKTIWCYTGYTIEQIAADARLRMILPYLDVLVDGRFELPLRDTDLLFRGSSNQRLIDVPATLHCGTAIHWSDPVFGLS